MNRLAITIFYVFVGVTSFAQPSVFEHPQKYWRYSYCYYADFRPVGIPDTGADIEVYDVGEVERTLPNGYTVYYEYDGFGRLTRVIEHDGNVVTHGDVTHGGRGI